MRRCSTRTRTSEKTSTAALGDPELLATQRAYGSRARSSSASTSPTTTRPSRRRTTGRLRRRRSDRRVARVRAGPRRDAGRGGDLMPRSRRAGNQAPPEGATVPSRRPEARARLRARRRAPRPHPHPRRARASPHADLLARLLDRHCPCADHRARRDRRPRRNGRTSPDVRAFDTSVWSALDSTLTGWYRRADRLRVRLPVRQAAELPPPRRAHGTCLGPRRPRFGAPLHDTATGIADGLEPVAPTAPLGSTEPRTRSPSFASTST